MTFMQYVCFIFDPMGLIDNYKVITVTHHNLDISDIGNFYIRSQEGNLYFRLRQLKSEFGLDELFYLETCNRVCFISFAHKTIDNEFLRSFFQSVNPDLEPETLDHIDSFADYYEGEAALRHVFEMASSMDSLVVGEREIFRQFRKAYDQCKQAGLTGDYLRILEKATVATAKKVYSTTAIAEKALSVVSLAIQAMINANDQKDQRILLIGSGETNTLAAKFLRKYNMMNVSIYNRSIDNARKLASFLDADSYHLNELDKLDGRFDTIIICTSANRVVIDQKLYKQMIKSDTSRKLVIDLAVPRNISEDVVRNFKLDYIDIGRLKKISEENLDERRKELEKARPIITSQILEFKDIFHQRQLEKAMASIPKEIKEVKKRAIEEVYGDRLESLDENAKTLVIEMMDYMEKKCISVPIKAAKKSYI